MDRRVVIVSDAWELGGAELYLAVLAGELAATHELLALLPERAPAETAVRLVEAGAGVRRVEGLGRRPSPRVVRRLVRELRAADPDLVHVNLTDQGDGLGPLLAARLARLPSVATLHVVAPGRSRAREALSRRALAGCRALVAVSEATAAWPRGRGLAVIVVPNGLPAPRAADGARAELAGGEAGFVVGGIGRLSRQKGWDVLCRAAAAVRAERPDAVFAVVGDGPERDALAAAPGCDAVRFLGYRSDASSLLAGMDVLAMPSRFEGLPLVAIEAMHAGVPVVASDVGGVREAVGDCGVLVPPEDPAALARALAALAADPERRAGLAARARERARERFTPERMAAGTAAVYEAALAR